MFVDSRPGLPADFVLNVAESRESKAPGIGQGVMALVVEVISERKRVARHTVPWR